MLLENDGTEEEDDGRDDDDGDDSSGCNDDRLLLLPFLQQCWVDRKLINNLIIKNYT